MRLAAFASLIVSLSLASTAPGVAAPVQRDHLEVELIAESAGIAPGGSTFVGLRMKHDPHWHTYWINPGDSGLPTKIAWTLPAGITAQPIAWPVPHRLAAGPLTNFGYDDEIVLPVELRADASVAPGTTLALHAKASWLVCEVECIPGDAELTLDLPVVDAAPAPGAAWRDLFTTARAGWPQERPAWRAELAEAGDDFVLTVDTGGDKVVAQGLEVFPEAQQLFTSAPGEARALDASLLQVTVPRSEYFTAMPASPAIVLRAGDGALYRVVASVAGARAASTGASASPSSTDGIGNAGGAGGDAPSFLVAFLLAFAGGVLLNLMPCVFPVLALKAFAIAQGAHEPARARRDGVFYFLGVLVAFLVLAGALIALRAGGAALGWGFQLQVPWVVGALAFLMIAVGLSLSGVFAIGGSWMGAGQSLASRDDARGAFFTGLLAVVVASPCTAPFMGPALGYAVTQPAIIALAVFAALAIGLALPLVLVSFVPAIARILPRPGAWMETFKQALAFPMYLTALWLLWVLGQQAGVDGMTQAAAGALALAFALWLFGRPSTGGVAARAVRGVAMAAALVASVWSLWTLAPVARGASAAAATSEYAAWSDEAIAAARRDDRPVLVNMTAAWCITCLANERVALSTDTVREAMKAHDVVYLKGDWTQRDAAITAYLARFGRNGVPLYVLYPRGGGAPRVLPQVLTPTLVADALRDAARGDAVTRVVPP